MMHQERWSLGACQLLTVFVLTQGRTNQDGLNAEDKFHFVLCTCDKSKDGIRLIIH